MIEEFYKKVFTKNIPKISTPVALISKFKLKEDMHVVYKSNKAWIFDYHNSVLYTLNQIGALLIYAHSKGHEYSYIIKAISNYYDKRCEVINSDIQSFLTDMLKKDLLKLV